VKPFNPEVFQLSAATSGAQEAGTICGMVSSGSSYSSEKGEGLCFGVRN
jgi:hypothetical protein